MNKDELLEEIRDFLIRVIENSGALVDGSAIVYRFKNLFGETGWYASMRNGRVWNAPMGAISTQELLDFIRGDNVIEAYLVTDKKPIKEEGDK